VFLFFFSACICHNYKLKPDLIKTIDKGEELPCFPESYRIVHRVRLDVRGRSFDFIGYMAVKGESWRAVAFTKLGGKIFDLLSRDGSHEVVYNPYGFPTDPLKFGVLRELGHIFAHPNPPHQNIGLHSDAPRKIIVKSNAKWQSELNLDRTKCLVSILLIQENCLVSEIDIQSFCYVNGWPNRVPERLRIINFRWGYAMDLELIRMDLRSVEDNVFKNK